MPKPFYKKTHDAWYFFMPTRDGRKLCRLGKTEAEAMEVYEREYLPKVKLVKRRRDQANVVKSFVDTEALRVYADAILKTEGERLLFARYMTRLAIVCRMHDMPDVPPPMYKVHHFAQMSPFCGVYFGWRGGECIYVGESTCIPKRFRRHDAIAPGDMLSFIPLADHKRAEHFYIWLINPPFNKRLLQKSSEEE